ncbi:MAG: hybrid sensor histidine kinase/response regulator [Bacteroidales bacterium]
MTPDSKKGSILILDDEKTNIQIIRKELDGDYTVYYALKVDDAFQILERISIDLILLDIMMPQMDGFAFYSQLKKRVIKNPLVRVIFITAKNDIDTMLKGFEVGAVDYITKPFEVLELRARVKNHMDLIQAKKDVETINETLEIQNSAKDRLFSIIGHDLRNPIGGVKSFLDLLLREKDYSDTDLKRTFNVLYESTSKAYSLLDDLLVWAKAQKNETRFSPQKKSILSVIQEVNSFLVLQAQEKQIDISVLFEKDIHAYFDYEMIKTVFRNLISNAIKFTPEQGRISIDVKEDEGMLTCIVADTGVGIPPENIDKLFDKKSYIKTEDTNNNIGTGLGLSICYDFVSKHDGSLWVESNEGEGTSFYFTLPRA